MNVAASTLILLRLLLPAMAFRRFYYSGSFSKQYASENFGRLLLKTFAIAVIIHAIAYETLSRLEINAITGYHIAIKSLISSAESSIGDLYLWSNKKEFVGFYGALIVVSAALGYILQYAIQKTKLDRRIKILRFNNYWHYLLRGGVRDFSSTKQLLHDDKGDIEYTFIDVLVSTSNGDMLYNGILVDYDLSSDNELETIVLTEVQRRKLDNDYIAVKEENEETRFYSIIGDLVVIPAKQIKNYNLRYITIVDIETASNSIIVAVNDADGDITSASYFNNPGQ